MFFVIALLAVSTSGKLKAQSVQTGKSYINVSKPLGGTIQNGDELEIRAVIAVSGNSVYFARYNDTIPAGVTYVANSIRFTTNEGMDYGTALRPTGLLTDAGGDDEARYNAGVLRVNIGSLTRTGGQTAAYNAVAAPNIIDIFPSASGCRIYNTGRPSFYGGTCIIMITYHVLVNTTAGNTINIPGGTFRYKTANTFSEATLPSTVRNLNRLRIMVTDPLPICNTVGGNSITGNGGNFGSGSTQNLSPVPAPGTVVPGYQWRAFAAPSNGPNDSMFTVANNTSPSGSINNNLAYPNSNRLFNLWDIIGDHTNATNPLLGNPATTPGQPGGYMAVVNAAYGINNAVQQKVTGLCPDTYYEFSAWFRNICRRCSSDTSGKGSGTAGFKNYMAPVIPNTNDSAGVLPNLTFQVDGSDYYTTGNLSYNGLWIKKGFLFKTGPAQTSVDIVIRNNAPGGGGNDWVMDDVAFSTCLPGLGMQPTNNPVYCNNGQVDMSVAVTSFYSNYSYYQWERSTDGGLTWSNAPLAPTPQVFSYTYNSPNYIDTVYYPSIIAGAASNGHKYRIRVATSLTNLTNSSCAAYNNTDIITIGVNETCDILASALVKFEISRSNNQALLHWQTSNMPPKVYFILERSTDAVHFYEAGRVDGKDPDHYSTLPYNWIDHSVLATKNYYRIKIVNPVNETMSYSRVAVLNTELPDFEVRSVTNPFHETVSAEIVSSSAKKVWLQLMDLSGRIIKKEQYSIVPGTNKIFLQHPAKGFKRMYILKIITQEKSVQKLIINE